MIAILNYNAGNIRSVQNAVSRLGYKSIITNNKTEIMQADKVIFPGVGEAGSAMKHLRNTGLDELIPQLKQPVLGICLGLQLMCEHSEEGDTDCLGIFKTRVKRFSDTDIVPHMGWNNVEVLKEEVLLNNITEYQDMYYVHSYYAEPCNETVALCHYITSFSSVLKKENFYACQFHPEKSSETGNQLLKNFLEL